MMKIVFYNGRKSYVNVFLEAAADRSAMLAKAIVYCDRDYIAELLLKSGAEIDERCKNLIQESGAELSGRL